MSITYEEALATLEAMFQAPWARETLDAVLRHEKGHMENTCERILNHGDKDPLILVNRLKAGGPEPQVAMDEELARQLSVQEHGGGRKAVLQLPKRLSIGVEGLPQHYQMTFCEFLVTRYLLMLDPLLLWMTKLWQGCFKMNCFLTNWQGTLILLIWQEVVLDLVVPVLVFLLDKEGLVHLLKNRLRESMSWTSSQVRISYWHFPYVTYNMIEGF
jgi:hypothetical protein